MMLFMIAGIIIFILTIITIIIVLINQVNEMKDTIISKRLVKKQYLIEVNKVGKIKLHEINRGGGFNYRQF